MTAIGKGTMTTQLNLEISVPFAEADNVWAAIRQIVADAAGTVIQGPKALTSDELTIFSEEINELLTAAGLTQLRQIIALTRRELSARTAGIGPLHVRTVVRALAKLDPPKILAGTHVSAADQVELLDLKGPNYLAATKAGYTSIRRLAHDGLEKVTLPRFVGKSINPRGNFIAALREHGYTLS